MIQGGNAQGGNVGKAPLAWHPLPEAQNVDFSKILGMALPGVEYVPTPLETMFKLSRGPQRPYIEKIENFKKLKNSKNPEIWPPYSPGLGLSYLARYAAPDGGAAYFANPNSSAEAYILHRMQ